MDNINTLVLGSAGYPEALHNLADPPLQLHYKGSPPAEWLSVPRMAVVGSRLMSAYGRQVTRELAGRAAEQGIVIVSGLALGVDAAAHLAALEAGGRTVAVLPSGLPHIYPATNRQLAARILDNGGCLISEYDENADRPRRDQFVARNRIIAGLADAVLITEAALKSGSLHTARFALEAGRDVLAVPGNITSVGAAGVNNLIKAGATPITNYQDILHALGMEAPSQAAQRRSADPAQQNLLSLLQQGTMDGAELLARSGLSATEFNRSLTMLELSGSVRPQGSNFWSLA